MATASTSIPAATPDEGALHSIATALGIDPETVVATAKIIKADPVGALKAVASEAGNELSSAAEHPVDTAKQIGQGVISAVTNPEAQKTAISHLKAPGIQNKVTGAEEYLTSGIPLVGGNLVKSEEQAAKGNLSGSLGTVIGTIAPMLTDTEGAENLKTHLNETAKTFVDSTKEGLQRAAEAKAPEGSLEAGFVKLRGKKVLNPVEATPAVTVQSEGPEWDRTHSAVDASGQKVGSVGYKLDPDGRAQIYGSVVNPELRGKGIGQKLYRSAIADAQDAGASRITSDATNTTPEANRVWEKLRDKGLPVENITHPNGKPGYQIDFDKLPEGVSATTPAPEFQQTLAERGQLPNQKVILPATLGAKYVGGLYESAKSQNIYTPTGAQELANHLGATVVGSVAKKGLSTHDLDLKVSNYNQPIIEAAMKAKGFEPVGSSVLSPKEIKSSGKDFGTKGDEWARAYHFENQSEPRQKVDIWHTEPAVSQNPLPPQPKLPNTGQYAAIQTDDGSIYYDRAPQKQRTHVMLAQDLNIPPERIVSGGWLKDGIYEETERSDAGRYGERARAKLAVESKRRVPKEVTPLQLKKVDKSELSETGYVYHATNEDRAYDIAQTGLKIHKPNAFTDQSSWPDGATEKRNYFTKTAEHTWQFAPEDGKPVLLRTKPDANFKTESTGDVYTKKTIKPGAIEILGNDNQWHSIAKLNPLKNASTPIPTKLHQSAATTDNMNDPDTRFNAARHEAAHAVISEALEPGSVNSTAITSNGGVTDIQPPAGKTTVGQLTPDEVRDMIATSYAGGLSEPGGTTEKHVSGDLAARKQVLGGRADTPVQNIERWATGDVLGTDQMLAGGQEQAEAKARVTALLADPKIQAQIDKLATHITTKGRLSGDEIRNILTNTTSTRYTK